MDGHRHALSWCTGAANQTVTQGETPLQKITPFLWFDGRHGYVRYVQLDEKSQPVMQAMPRMDKIDIQDLQEAYMRQ